MATEYETETNTLGNEKSSRDPSQSPTYPVPKLGNLTLSTDHILQFYRMFVRLCQRYDNLMSEQGPRASAVFIERGVSAQSMI